MAVHIVEESEPYRLIRDDQGRFAVIEARAGHVYSLHAEHRTGADDTPQGMESVVGDGWRDEAAARRRYSAMCRREEGYGRIIW